MGKNVTLLGGLVSYTRRLLVTSDCVGLSSSWCWLWRGWRGKQGDSSRRGNVGDLQDEESLEKMKYSLDRDAEQTSRGLALGSAPATFCPGTGSAAKQQQPKLPQKRGRAG